MMTGISQVQVTIVSTFLALYHFILLASHNWVLLIEVGKLELGEFINTSKIMERKKNVLPGFKPMLLDSSIYSLGHSVLIYLPCNSC